MMRTNANYFFMRRGWRSALALVSSSVAWVVAEVAIAGGLILYANDDENPLELFRYFTTLTNLVTSVGAGMLFPFAVEGLRRRNFSCPRWATMFFYSGTICSTLTMLFATLVIGRYDPVMAFGGYNLYLHIVCPLLTIVTFFLVESDSRYSTSDAALCTLPVPVYALVYLIEVGSERGGWDDMYQVADLLPHAVTFTLITLLAFGLAQVIRIVHGRICDMRMARLVERHLAGELTEVDVRLSVLELGELVGRHEDEDFVVLPLKSLSIMAERYSLRREELVEIYARALVDTMDQRRGHQPTPDRTHDQDEEDGTDR